MQVSLSELYSLAHQGKQIYIENLNVRIQSTSEGIAINGIDPATTHFKILESASPLDSDTIVSLSDSSTLWRPKDTSIFISKFLPSRYSEYIDVTLLPIHITANMTISLLAHLEDTVANRPAKLALLHMPVYTYLNYCNYRGKTLYNESLDILYITQPISTKYMPVGFTQALSLFCTENEEKFSYGEVITDQHGNLLELNRDLKHNNSTQIFDCSNIKQVDTAFYNIDTTRRLWSMFRTDILTNLENIENLLQLIDIVKRYPNVVPTEINFFILDLRVLEDKKLHNFLLQLADIGTSICAYIVTKGQFSNPVLGQQLIELMAEGVIEQLYLTLETGTELLDIASIFFYSTDLGQLRLVGDKQNPDTRYGINILPPPLSFASNEVFNGKEKFCSLKAYSKDKSTNRLEKIRQRILDVIDTP